ncbi:AAA family ATPase [Caballeronia sp. LZ001]|uniref:ParA family protein n=1 Tax=Caballeronia sp. LZ001 TaxID=3038553 RepID=UPI002861C106|nr:AAA family ATPase [Caballeronia sp. LZ001]MDR5800332.1 AAA family ATPase [Caballeronia sp. LZ001]
MYRSNLPHVLSFINLKGGVGKTTTAVAVAEMLAHELRKRVLLIDLDPQTNATINLISEKRWDELDREGQTIAQLFEDKINLHRKPKFDVEKAIVRGVSTVDGGIARLDLLPSSIRLIDFEERIAMISYNPGFLISPLDVLRQALEPVLERYEYVIIDCPPSLGSVTKNGLRISTGYVIPTIPDIVSTWGIYQIVQNVRSFGARFGRVLEPLGIVATKVQRNNLHARVMEDLFHGRLGKFSEEGVPQPRFFKSRIPLAVDVARGGDADAGLRTLKSKYGIEAYEALHELALEIWALCEARCH